LSGHIIKQQAKDRRLRCIVPTIVKHITPLLPIFKSADTTIPAAVPEVYVNRYKTPQNEWHTALFPRHAHRRRVKQRSNINLCLATDCTYSRKIYIRALTAETRETDRILRQEGYPIAKYWTNSHVRHILGRCSKPHHKLQTLH
jgi:hypothetical protein